MATPWSATRQHGTRQDTWVVRLSIGGNHFGIWDKKTGGELDSDEVVYYPGGMLPKLSLGGRVMPGNITLQKLYDGVDDHKEHIGLLMRGVGKWDATVTQRPLDLNGQPYGKAIQWKGKLKRVLVPDVDSEATSAAMLEVEITVEGTPQVINA